MRRLNSKGFKVWRLKDQDSKEQTLKLNGKGELQWSKMSSFVHKSQPISALKKVEIIESSNEEQESFVLDFELTTLSDDGVVMTKTKSVHFRIKESEFPFDAQAMMQYLTAIVKKLEIDSSYITNICSIHDNEEDDSEGDENHSDDDDDDGNGSDTGSTTSNVSSKSITGRFVSLIRRHSFNSSSQHQQQQQSWSSKGEVEQPTLSQSGRGK